MTRALLLPLLLLAACSAESGLNFERDTSGAPSEDIPEGTLRLDVTPPASAGAGTLLTQSIIVPPDSYEGLEVELVPTRTVTGTLTALVSRGWSFGPPAVEEELVAELSALPGEGRASGAARSAEDGTFTLSYPAYPGRGTQIAIVPDDASMAPIRVVAAPSGNARDWDQLIPTGIPVYGRVVGVADGVEQGIPGVDMRLSRVAADGTLTSGVFTTDDSGWYVARVDEIGEYTLEVVGGPTLDEEHIAPTLAVPVLVESETGVEIPVELGEVDNVSAQGVVVDANAARFPEARVRFTSVELDGGPGSLVAETDASRNGDFITTFLLPGTYDIDVMPPYSSDGVLASAVRYEDVRIGAAVEIGAFAVGAPGRLEGQVFAADGDIAGNVIVVATEVGFGGNVYHGRTDQSGNFALTVPDVPLTVAFTPSSPGDGAVTHVSLDRPTGSFALQLDPGVLVNGVLIFEGVPVPYGSVDVRDAASGLLLGQALSDDAGYFSLRVSVPERAETDTDDDTGAADTGSEDTGAEDTADE